MKYNFPLTVLLCLVFLIEILFSVATPIWHGPDEQAHFGQVANWAEQGATIYGTENLNKEILESEILLGTARDEKGNNKFTFNPNYKIEYTNSNIGLFEASIAAFPKSFRQELVISEATVYPPLYYMIGSVFYKLAYENSLIDRVYVTRLLGIFLALGTAYLSWLFAKELFAESPLKRITLTVMVSYHPMLNFVFATVNSDNLFNFYFSGGLLLGIKILKNGLQAKYTLFVSSFLLLGFLIKPQFVLLFLIFFFAIIIGLIKNWSDKGVKVRSLIFLGIGIILPTLTIIMQLIFKITLFKTLNVLFLSESGSKINTWDFLKMTLYRTYHETIPWYWGVFDWLGVVLPRMVNRTLNYLVVGSGIGLGMTIISQYLRKDWDNLSLVLYLLWCSLSYFAGVVLFDFFYMGGTGISIGMQGRYFFPVVFAHMSLIIIGTSYIGKLIGKDVGENMAVKILGLGFIALNNIGLYTILKSYYEFTTLTIFLNQLSQYKPALLKGPGVLIILLIYLYLLVIFLYTYLKKVRLNE